LITIANGSAEARTIEQVPTIGQPGNCRQSHFNYRAIV
jgi:hypothetical protein